MPSDETASKLAVLLFTDVVGSTALKDRLGTNVYAKLLRRHNELFEQLCKQFADHQVLKHTGDGYFAEFATASDAVRFALLFQSAIRSEKWTPEPLSPRVGIHAGEVAVMTMMGKSDVIGLAADVAARVMSLAEGGQILLTRGVFDDARQFIDEHPKVSSDEAPRLRWMAHGPYLFKGTDRLLEVFEVGAEGLAPLRAPGDSEKARQVATPEQRRFAGWRPAAGQTVPLRPDWRLQRRLNRDDGHETWIGQHRLTGEKRNFRFAFSDAETASMERVQTVASSAGTDRAASRPDEVEFERDSVPPFSVAAHHSASSAESSHPAWIGSYKILGKIGEGGMGVVYRAEQRDPIRREVALKVIKLGMDTREVIARFEAERQALAIMNHPGIAKVFDAGATPEGRPYFVMEYVNGERISDYCDRHNLETRQRLELFGQLCEAVQHAHSKGIIHRDIKPSNVLVRIRDDAPSVTVIDFGVAKATAQQLAERSVFTELGQLIGTPEYVSPEQAEMNNLDIDTRSDIYSLGVVLYELLTGALPFEPATLRSAAWNEIQRIIREVEPPRPSTRLSTLGDRAAEIARKRQVKVDALADELRDELEWIPLKAMRKDRYQRYRTASEMADDIKNYLAGRPLIAGPESTAYKAKKFIKRNKASVITAASVLLAGVVALILISAAWRNAAVARKQAEEAQREAEAHYARARDVAKEFFVGVSQNEALKFDSLSSLRRGLLRKAEEFFRSLAAEARGDARKLGDLALALNLLGDAHRENGDAETAVAYLTEAVAVRHELARQRPTDVASQVALADALINLASANDSRPAEFKKYIGEAISMLQPLHVSKAGVAATRSLAQAEHNLGHFFEKQEDFKSALSHFEIAIELRRDLKKTDHQNNLLTASELAKSLRAAARHLSDQNLDLAAEYFQEAIALNQFCHKERPEETPILIDLAENQSWMGDVESRRGNHADARKWNKMAADSHQNLATNPKHFGPRKEAAVAWHRVGWAHLLLGNPEEARKVTDLALELISDDPLLIVNKGHVLLLSGHKDEAIATYRSVPTEAIDLKTIADYVRDDLKTLRAAGVPVPDPEKIAEAIRVPAP